MNFSPEVLRKRFHENRDERDAILAKSTPLREERDRLIHQNNDRIAELNAQIKEAEAGLFDLDMEAGTLVRALGGKTGPRPLKQ